MRCKNLVMAVVRKLDQSRAKCSQCSMWLKALATWSNELLSDCLFIDWVYQYASYAWVEVYQKLKASLFSNAISVTSMKQDANIQVSFPWGILFNTVLTTASLTLSALFVFKLQLVFCAIVKFPVVTRLFLFTSLSCICTSSASLVHVNSLWILVAFLCLVSTSTVLIGLRVRYPR